MDDILKSIKALLRFGEMELSIREEMLRELIFTSTFMQPFNLKFSHLYCFTFFILTVFSILVKI